VLVAPSMLAAAIGWDRVRGILADGRDPLLVVAAVLVWVAIWLGGLVLAGVGAAVRSAAWTLELPVTERPAAGQDALPADRHLPDASPVP
jgi:hypothetical protein